LRAELKRKLVDGSYDPFAERIIKWVRRIFPRLPQGDIAPFLVLNGIYSLSVSLLFLLDGGKHVRERIFVTIPSSILVLSGIFLYARLYRQLYRVLSEQVIDALTQPQDIQHLSYWLSTFGNTYLPLIFLLVFGSYLVFYMAHSISPTYGEFGISGLAGMVFGNFVMALVLHHVFFLMLFPLILSRYHIDLYELDPISSPSIWEISLVIRNSVYVISVYATVFSLYMFYVLKMPVFPLGYVYFVPILGIFIFRQIGLSLIIGRARWLTLERLSERIEQLDVEHHFDNPVIQNQYKAMLDYYNRVKNAEAGVFDARTGMLLFNSFLLPLIAFILFQFDRLVAFIGRFVH
jgi:hypothetical protein